MRGPASSRSRSSHPGGDRTVREARRDGTPFALYEHLDWQDRFPGLAVGLTAAGPGADFGFGTVSPPTRFFEAHARLATQLGFRLEAMVRQVHGTRVVRWGRPVPGADSDGDGAGRGMERGAGRRTTDDAGPGLCVTGRADGLVTDRRGVLLAITAADCVPVYLLDPSTGVLGLFHAGWRGTAAGVLERGVERALETGARAESVLLHLGPAICGACYEVGDEVLDALGLATSGPSTVDLRDVLVERARRSGIEGDRLSRSAWCTRCGGDRFHSHRGTGGSAGRMAAYMGWQTASDRTGDRSLEGTERGLPAGPAG